MPYKGLIQRRLKALETVRQSQLDYWLPPPGGGLSFALDYRLTRKRVGKLFHTDLVRGYVLLQLILNIFPNRLFVPSYCVHVIAAAPEMSVAVLVFQIRMTIKDHQTALSLQVTHDFRHAVLRWYLHIQMYVIRHCCRFQYRYPFSCAQRPYDLSYIRTDLLVYYLSSILRGEYYVIFTIPFRVC